jgi:HEAT repeat protein
MDNDISARALAAAERVHPLGRDATVSAVRSLLSLASTEEQLRELLDNHSAPSEQKVLVCWLAGRLSLVELWPSMAALATDDDEPDDVRLAAIEGLGFLRLVEVLDTLLTMTTASSVQLRVGAVRALQWREEVDQVKGRLLQIATDIGEDSEVRAQATESLGSFEGADVATALKNLLLEQCSEVRYNAAWALGQLKDVAAIGPLTELLADSSVTRWGTVREAVQEAIVRIRKSES